MSSTVPLNPAPVAKERRGLRGPGLRRVLLALLLAVGLGAAVWYVGWKLPADRARAAYLHAARGVERQDAGDFPGAIRAFETATRLEPKNSQAWYLLGRAHLRTREGGPAGLEALGRAAKLSPNDAVILREYGVALQRSGRPDEARSVLERTVSLAPTDVEARVELAQAYLARVSSPADLDAGINALKTSLELQPGDIQARFRLARAFFQADRLAESRREFDTILMLMDRGARERPGLMNGQTEHSAMWLSIVKGAHHYLAQMEVRTGKVQDGQRRRTLHKQMEGYIRETYEPFIRLNASPNDERMKARLAQIYRKYGLPPQGPDGPTAADRWIGSLK